MRSHEVGTVPTDRDTRDGWEVVRPPGGTSLDGVAMAGFRDRAAAGLDMRVLPQPAVTVVIGFGAEPFAVENAAGHRLMRSLVAALSPGPARIRGEHVECVEVHLSPRAAYALLGVSPRELDGPIVDLESLWGRHGRRLHERLAEAVSWRERLTLTEGFLARRAAGAPSMSPEVAAAWDTIVARRGRVRIGDLAASCGWSRKRLWSRFGAQIGLTPKRAAMLVRFDHAARALRAGGNPSDVALACGYVDQSHLHRDALALAGCTPGSLAAG
ncbi:helix-turn-helix domain-containing protein [Actinomadura kijaniata]|uniref:AraC-like DNA-binding protein n=1 Tax=Actinomadura namibiensis TaxID=182080 RepID=A0A7W3LNW6_ACTNM|nr:helix-turn-helix domain-containing protein [Actinomadura namibiensis]MBA8951559.1 AraC-like DNA-binding protein [Actinomadura namibiensis]